MSHLQSLTYLKMLDLRLYSAFALPSVFSQQKPELICKAEFIEAAGFGSPVSGKVPAKQVRIILNVFCFVLFSFCLQTASV